ncbi:MAG: preprotein translocase subunit YajC [Lachnospiraceae bacterium]|nr:preprotein translocase subunit YajC [Lachnospiraceae bacterium]
MYALTDSIASFLGSGTGMLIYIVFILGLMYFIFIRPQRNEQKRLNALISSVEVGDSILTTSGFYGVVIDINDDVIIVEFGNNKNCRIPMDKTAIQNVEKAEK